ncbi:MAG: Unknown protein [uncultured Sulfurovum sp.]|uniref:Uncharacterized protein n=1 Tax=uncultured Sulfurovum sp. TaxID=269237 RepID=A0A6S6TBA8_9BACT|nr:MAG: Unknown protein [uncultured Sulfurovum sp.]
MSKIFRTLLFSLIFFTHALYAIESSELPKTLQDWTAWILDNEKEKDCPIDFSTNEHICTYPTQIAVHVHEHGLTFNMMVAVFKNQQKIELPHAYQNWVKEVHIDGEKRAVLGSSKAMVFLDEGEHKIEGTIVWKEAPKYLQLSSNMALITLYKEGKKITTPKVDAQSRLWLSDNEEESNKKGTLSVSIYRKLMDGHPMKMQTNLHFRVSGKMRSVLLDGIVLEGFYPSRVLGNLDAKINKDKKLEVQVKAGEWVLNIDSFSPTNLLELRVPKHSFKYANQETLSLQTDASYRSIEILNAQSIDPSQSNLPKAWKNLALYLLEEEKSLTIKELYKSVKQQEQNDFVLKREVWLDYDGKGYSFKDNIQANISKVKRLESSGVFDLGSVSINTKPMLINTLNSSEKKGVELREKNMDIEASSRYENNRALLPVNGWSEAFDKVSLYLNLPPGWRVFASFGSDSQSAKSWVKSWNLMDIFLVLLLSIAIYQLFGLKWAIPATFFLLILWHEASAPTIIWLWILALVALIRVLGEGKMKKVLQVVFALSSIVVILNVLQFSVYKVRTTLYPQLEKVPYVSTYASEKDNAQSRGRISKEVYQQESMDQMVVQSSNYAKTKKMMIPKKKQILLQNKIDPNAIVQTGEGTPTWNWSHHSFFWQSTVGLEDKLEIWFITPTMTKVLNILNVVGMLFLLWMFLQAFLKSSFQGLKEKLSKSQGLKAMFFLPFLLLGTAEELKANEIPSTELLQQLKEKLLEKPTCLPHCASIEQMEVLVEEETLFININISAGLDVAVPILGNRNIWLPEDVSVNDSDKSYLQLDKEGGLWVMLRKGIHKVSLRGSIKGLNQIMLMSKLPIHNLDLKESALWKLNSDDKSYIELVNVDKKSSESREKTKSSLEPMVEVTRTFYFGLRWYVETQVRLLNKIDKPYTLNYALLENESVLNKEIEVNGKEAILQLHNNHPAYQWRSSLPISLALLLKASAQNSVMEEWKMDISSMWNMHHEGVESEKQVAHSNQLMPTFRPWKNETLNLTLEAIKAVKGKSLTIESSDLSIVQSQRYRDLTLKLRVQSSRAQQHTIVLENVKELSSVKIDEQDHYLKIKNAELSIPLKGKAQTVVIKWKEESGTQSIYNFSKINLNKDSVNSNVKLHLPQNRWVLWTNGPLLGPAVLLWGVLLSVLIFALILGRVSNSPLKVSDWLLLGVGVSTSSVMIMIPIVAWIFLLRYKEQKKEALQGGMRNFIQVLIGLFTVVALATLVGAVSVGLLGNPDMMIEGNNSYGLNLNWYSDRIGETLAQPMVVSVSMWYYRALMLLWAIWISFSLINWLKWAWKVFSAGDMWVKKEKVAIKAKNEEK